MILKSQQDYEIRYYTLQYNLMMYAGTEISIPNLILLVSLQPFWTYNMKIFIQTLILTMRFLVSRPLLMYAVGQLNHFILQL